MNPKSLLIFFIVNFASDSYGQKSKKFFRNDYTYMEELQSFYKIHTVPQTWADAKRVCALEQATFWHPENDDEANALLSFWKKTKPSIKKLYVALSDLSVEGSFETIDGKSAYDVYNRWNPGEPNNDGNVQHCATLHLETRTLDDDSCYKKFPIICKKTLQSLTWNDQCDMPNLDYTNNNNNGKCYKLHTTPLNWNEAKAVCQLEQSSLANVNNQLDADYLSKLTESAPKPRAKGFYQRGIYHLGFYYKFDEGWRTVGGTPLNAERDAWFDNHQPDFNEHEECGSMFYTGRLININCDIKSFFICEHARDNIRISDSQPYVGGGVE